MCSIVAPLLLTFCTTSQLLKDLPGLDAIEITGKYPVMEVDYTSLKGPVTVRCSACDRATTSYTRWPRDGPAPRRRLSSPSPNSQVNMEACSPCIGLDSKNSCLPAIYFVFSVVNTSNAAVEATLMMSQQNLAGWNGADVIENEVENAGYGGNLNAKLGLQGITAIDMSKTTLSARGSGM